MRWSLPSLRPFRSLLVAGLALLGFALAAPRHAWAQG
jgi:hypothetical protein